MRGLTATLLALALASAAGGGVYAATKTQTPTTVTPPNGQPEEPICSTNALDKIKDKLAANPQGCVQDLSRTQAPTGKYKLAFVTFDGTTYTHVGPSLVNPQASAYQATMTSYGTTAVKVEVLDPESHVVFTKDVQRGDAGLLQVSYIAHDAGDAVRIIDSATGTTTVSL